MTLQTTQAPPCRIFLVDDHDMMREVVRAYLGAIPGLSICGEAHTGEEALERLAETAADLVVVDTSLPTMGGIDLVAALHDRWADLPCLMLSGHSQESYVERALDAGARGYVLKGQPSELPEAIRRIMEGGRYLSPRLRMPE